MKIVELRARIVRSFAQLLRVPIKVRGDYFDDPASSAAKSAS